MLSKDENRFLCDVEPGAPMHDAFKRYWLPCGLSCDLPEPDCDPKRVTLLGEDYVLFRDSHGQAALMRELCCHRGASLALGRVEDGGIRCIYHGWKFAADGTILDMPNCDDPRFKSRYRQPAFPVREAGGIIWAYIGQKEHQPPLPDYPFFHVPDMHRLIEIPVFEGNYLQVMEGGLDSSHLGVLHGDVLEQAAAQSPEQGAHVRPDVAGVFIAQKAPRFEVEDEEFGCRYAAIRDIPGPDGKMQSIARVTAFALPATCFIAPDNTMLFALPVTNRRTHFYHIFWNWDEAFTAESAGARRRMLSLDDEGLRWGLGRRFADLPEAASRANNWRQDREAMRAGRTFSGIDSFVPEDAAVTASCGPIFDRSHENLVTADMGLARVRRILADNAPPHCGRRTRGRPGAGQTAAASHGGRHGGPPVAGHPLSARLQGRAGAGVTGPRRRDKRMLAR